MRKLYLTVLFALTALIPSAGTRAVVTPATPSAGTNRYSVLMMDRTVGFQTSTVTPTGEYHFEYQYNDRGRGPRLTSRIVFGPNGVPEVVENSGYDYLKARVFERFNSVNGRATWSNRNERANRAVMPNAFYISMSGVPEETALLARALLATQSGRLSLLPEGEARIRRTGEARVKSNGRERNVVLYTISGLDFGPTAIWLDDDQSFFALHYGWLSVIREGWESALPKLVKEQEASAAAYWERLSKGLAHQPEDVLAFRHVRVFDAEHATTRANMTVVVSGDRITAVGPEGTVTVPPGAQIIDARGKTLLPGLWDMHAHLNDTDGPLNLAAGVTTVRDLGSDIDKLQDLSRRLDSGRLAGPRVIKAGLIDGPGYYAGPTKVFATNEAEARAWVNRYADLGYEQIKVYSSVEPKLVPVIVDQARKRGLRVGGHVPAFMSAEEAVHAGFMELQHANFLFLNFLADAHADTRQAMRFVTVAEHGSEVDPAAANVQAFIQKLSESGVVVDPTLGIFESMFTDRAGQVSKSFAPVADKLPPQVRRGVLVGGLPVPHGMDDHYRASFGAMLKMVKALHDAGVGLVAGTDSVGGFPLHRELELYAEAGIPAAEVLRIATFNAAKLMKHDDKLGSIAPGKVADLLLVDGNPAARISDIRRVQTVVKNGVLYNPSELYDAIGVR